MTQFFPGEMTAYGPVLYATPAHVVISTPGGPLTVASHQAETLAWSEGFARQIGRPKAGPRNPKSMAPAPLRPELRLVA